jgi:hypothetical protein
MSVYLISYVPGATNGEGLGNFRRDICDSRPSAESMKNLYSQESPIRFAEVVEHEGDLAILTKVSLPAIYNGLGLLFAAEAKEKLAIDDADRLTVPGDGEEGPILLSDADLKALRTLADFRPVKKFKNIEEGRRKLFAMVVGGSTPVTSSAASAPPASTNNGEPSQEGTANMATTTKTKKAGKKAAKAKKASTPRAVAPLTAPLGAGNKPGADMTAGCYIRSLVMLGELTNAEILKKVHTHFKDSTAKGSDISWNRGKLKAAGKKVPDVVREAKAA